MEEGDQLWAEDEVDMGGSVSSMRSKRGTAAAGLQALEEGGQGEDYEEEDEVDKRVNNLTPPAPPQRSHSHLEEGDHQLQEEKDKSFNLTYATAQAWSPNLNATQWSPNLNSTRAAKAGPRPVSPTSPNLAYTTATQWSPNLTSVSPPRHTPTGPSRLQFSTGTQWSPPKFLYSSRAPAPPSVSPPVSMASLVEGVGVGGKKISPQSKSFFLRLEMKIQPKSDFCGASIAQAVQQPHPVNVTVEYPQDIQLQVNAFVTSSGVGSGAAVGGTTVDSGADVVRTTGSGGDASFNMNQTFFIPTPNNILFNTPRARSDLPNLTLSKVKVMTLSQAREKEQVKQEPLRHSTLSQKYCVMMDEAAAATDGDETCESGSAVVSVSGQAKEQKLSTLLRTFARQSGAWGVFEQEDYVLSHLSQVTQLLTIMNNKAIKRVTRLDNYKNVKIICLYFALERRWPIQAELINALDLITMKDNSSMAVIMGETDFPVDLTKAIRRELSNSCGDEERILACCSLLACLLRSGYQLGHLERIDAKFPSCLLQISEGIGYEGASEELRDTAVALLLAFNMHFLPENVYSNTVISAVSDVEEADYLKQRMLHLLLNQKTGHFHNTKIFFPSRWCHMVVKFVMDVLSSSQTTGFFMENDLNILLAGLNLYIPELEPGDDKRTTALYLARVILRRLNHKHPGLRRMVQMFKGILLEKESESRNDQKIVKKIAKEIEGSRLTSKF